MPTTAELIAQADEDLANLSTGDLIKLVDKQTKPAAPASSKSNLRDDVTFLGSEKTGKAVSALFPRTAKAVSEGKGGGRRAGSALLDVLSIPGRGVASLNAPDKASRLAPVGPGGSMIPVQPDAVAGRQEPEQGFLEAMADTKGKNIAGKIVRDPGTAAALLTAPFTGGLSAAPLLASLGPKAAVYAALAAQGAAAGTASAAAHQGENVVEGKDVKPGQAAGEIALSALLPVAAKGIGDVGMKAGKGFMQSILKPSKFLREQEKINMGDVIETLGSARPFKGSVSGMAKKAAQLESGLSKEYGDIVAQNAAKKINVRGSLGTTKKGFENAFTNEKKFGDVIHGLRKGGEYWDDISKQQGSQAGWYDLPGTVELRKSVGRAGRYNANKDPRELEGPAQFARELYKNLTSQESRIVPQLAPVKDKLSKLYPLQEAVENAQGRTANNFYPGLTDNIALAAAAQASKPELTIPGLLLFLANRTVKNPAAASAMYKAGQAAANPSVAQRIAREVAKRGIAQEFRDED